MKKLIFMLALTILTGSFVIGAEAKASPDKRSAGTEYNYQILRQIIRRTRHRRWGNNRNDRVTYETRIVHKGRKTFRDTYRITWHNGRRSEKRVDRVRIN